LELLGGRVLTLTAEVRDLQHRFTAVESRFGGLRSAARLPLYLEAAMGAPLVGPVELLGIDPHRTRA
jgi:hypothetical protein